MAIDKTRALPPKTLRDDFEAFNALKAVALYSPVNAAFTLANGTALKNAMDAADAKAAQDRAQAAASTTMPSPLNGHFTITSPVPKRR